MKILIVSPDFPFPPNHGGRADIFSRIVALSKLFGKENIDLISTISSTPDESELSEIEKYTKHSITCRRSSSALDLINLNPHQIKSRSSLRNIKLPAKNYDITLLEGDYVSEILNNRSANLGKIILRVHNNESNYFKKLAESTKSWRKLYYFGESIKFSRSSELLNTRVDRKLYISLDELSKGDSRSFWLPPTISRDSFKRIRTTSDGHKVLFVGSLFMPNNIFGLKWYLDRIHQKLAATFPDYQLTIVGNSKKTSTEWLSKYSNTRFLGELNDLELDCEYQSNDLFIAPIFHGAGVKIKIINAIANGIPVITTTVGNEGTGLTPNKEILVSDTHEDFLNSIIKALNQKNSLLEIATNAQSTLRKNFSEERLSIVMDEIIKI
jgi:glycosyltransferase involved in cell wall biosynthesis